MTKISRRQALLGTLALGAAGCTGEEHVGGYQSPGRATTGAFLHGIASGDATATSIILWTRIAPTGPEASAIVPVTWEISTDEDFSNILAQGNTQAVPANDWTVKVDATDLPSGQTLYYRFISGAATSPVGRTKTLPKGKVEKARFAVVSCAHWQFGFFNAYDHIARQKDFDAVIHLGDYLYEYGTDGYGGPTGKKIGRLHEPAREILTLAEYRTRHGQYKTDLALQALHQTHPMICLWDDHEVANDSWKGGAQNHQLDEGEWEARRRAAMQAYYEWMPVRDPVPGRAREALYKSYSWGDLLTITTIETRLTARAKQITLADYQDTFTSPEAVEKFKTDIVGAKDRYLLGDAQLDYLTTSLSDSKKQGQPWQIIANQILMADVRSPDVTPYIDEETIQNIEPFWDGIRAFVDNSALSLPVYLDCWGGYPFARERLYDRLADKGITDLLVLTGDAHEFWVNDLITDDDNKIGVELCTSSVTAGTLVEFLGDGTKDYALLTTKENECVRYYDPMQNGYIDLTLTPEKGHADLVVMDTVLKRHYNASITASFDLVKKNGSVEFAKPKGLGLRERALYEGLG